MTESSLHPTESTSFPLSLLLSFHLSSKGSICIIAHWKESMGNILHIKDRILHGWVYKWNVTWKKSSLKYRCIITVLWKLHCSTGTKPFVYKAFFYLYLSMAPNLSFLFSISRSLSTSGIYLQCLYICKLTFSFTLILFLLNKMKIWQ